MHHHNLGPCGAAASGRWGEATEERLFFLKTIKTAGSTVRGMFDRFAEAEGLGRLGSVMPGGILFNAREGQAEWLPCAQWRPPDCNWPVRRVPAGSSPFHYAGDHSSYMPDQIREYLPGARMVTVSREPLGSAISAISLFFEGMPLDKFVDRATTNSLARKDQVVSVNSVAFQLGVPAAAEPLPLNMSGLGPCSSLPRPRGVW